MWTESRYPNTAALMARSLWGAIADRGEVYARTGSTLEIDMPWLSSGGKVIPLDGQEHSRPEL
jgi:hypothetical protein